MAVDLRQVMAAFLTFSMFVMLGNMIKRDHFDPFFLEPYPESTIVHYNSLKVSKPTTFKLAEISDGLWRPNNEVIQPCWKKHSFKERKQSNNGYIFFTLSGAPEYHASQVANAVAVASHVGAQLAIPGIRGSSSGHIMQFGEIYDVETFVRSLKGIVEVDKNPPADVNLPIVNVPDGVSEDFIASKLKPLFRSKPNLTIVTHFNSSSTEKLDDSSTAYHCIAMFKSLKLQPDLQQLVNSMVATLRSLSQKIRGHYIAVDLRVDDTFCQANKRCYNAQEIREFLRNIGVERETCIYLARTRWSNRLSELRDVFPNTFTKDAIMADDQKASFKDYEKMIDLYMCAESDIFIPSFLGRFYSVVVGRRIAKGKTQILIPAKNASSTATATHYVSPYIAKRSHFAYACFC